MSKVYVKGDKVTFKPGPKSKSSVTAEVTEIDGQFLVTKGNDGTIRRIRPGACTTA